MRVRRLSVVVLAMTVLLAGAASTGAGVDGRPKSFALAIGNGNLKGGPAEVAERLGDYDLVVIDGEQATPEDIAAMRAAQTHVFAYLSVGTIERWRSWYPRLKPFRLGANRDWEGEWYADVSNPELRRELVEQIAPQILGKGFEGLFFDNVDMVELSRHRSQRQGMAALLRDLAAYVHGQARIVSAQNGARALREMGVAGLVDIWNREDVSWTYDFERRRYVPTSRHERRAALDQLRRFAELGKVVTATDYTRAGDESAVRESVRRACSVGAVPYVADLGLTARRLPDPPLTCE